MARHNNIKEINGIVLQALEGEIQNLYSFDSVAAVSYTHLDVYKRQAQYCAIDESSCYVRMLRNRYDVSIDVNAQC